MVNFAQLLEGMLGLSLEELNAMEKKDIASIQVTGDDSKRVDFKKTTFILIHELREILEDFSEEGCIEVKAIIPDFALFEAKIKSNGLSKALKIPIKLIYEKLAQRLI